MDVQKIFFPLGVAAAVIGIWVALRKPNVGPTQSNQISPSASGLPNYTPQAVSYQVNPPQLATPTQAQLLSNPWNPNPALPQNPQYQTPPPYLAFNFGPGHDLSKIPLSDAQIQQLNGTRQTQQPVSCSGNCGGCGNGSCGGNQLSGISGCSNDPNKSIFPDGRGGFMAPSGKTLVSKLNRQDPMWPQRATYNLAGSDIDPNSLPFRHNAIAQQNALQPGQATPSAPNQSLSVSSPGSAVVNNSDNTSSVKPNIQPIRGNLGALNQFGNQVLQLPADAISRLTGTLWTS